MNSGEEYLEAQVMTASPYRLHLMVIDGALRYARKAHAALQERDFETAHFSLNDARRFVTELIAGLDADRDPELVGRLRSLFAFVYRNLVTADMEHNPVLVQEAIEVIESYRETWLLLGERIQGDQQASNDDADATVHEWST